MPHIPTRLLRQPRYPTPEPKFQTALAAAADETTRFTLATAYVMHLISLGAPFDEIERRIQIQPGSLLGLLTTDHDRDLRLRFCGALCARAETFDRRAQKILAAVAGGAVRDPKIRAAMDIANSLRCMGEGSRRESEAYFRRTTLAPDKEQARDRRRLQIVWDAIVGARKAFLPGIPVVLSSKAFSDPLTAAHEILPQLKKEHDARIAAGANSLNLMELRAHIRRCDRYIRSRAAPTSPAPSAAAQQQRAPIPRSVAQTAAPPTSRSSSPATPPKHPTATDEYLAAHPEARDRFQHEHGGRITIDLLRDTLEWVRTLERTPLRARQIASLEGRLRECDFDTGEPEDEEAKMS